MRRVRGLTALAAIALASIVVMGGCDWFGGPLDNEIEYKGSVFPIEHLYVVNWGLNGAGYYDIGIYLTESSLTMDENANFSGAGTYTYAEVSLSASSLQEGEYTWGDPPTRVLHRLHDGGIEVNWNTGPGLAGATGGEVIVAKGALTDAWIVNLTLQTPDGDVEANYNGEITLNISTLP